MMRRISLRAAPLVVPLVAALVLALAWPGGTAEAATCRAITEKDVPYTVCKVSAGEDLRLFLTAPDGRPYGSFERLATAISQTGGRLVFAMNGGMYHPDRSPVGLYLERGRQSGRLVTSKGPGNFGLLPNGVFCIGKRRFRVVESRSFRDHPPECLFASQSGPMLVIDGKLHPKFLKDSTSRHLRNGVGVSADGRTAWFAISDQRVTFHQFASLFRDRLKTPDALYFDGTVSRLYAPELGRSDSGLPLGPMVGLVEPRKPE